MALSATTIAEVQTGGSDANNSGLFDPGQTAGMFTDGAATVANTGAPVFTSASYNFVAGDVGARVFVASGTNWTPGWYPIAAVAANAATLSAAVGTPVQSLNANAVTSSAAQLGPSTVVGCATVASPTGATWSIDYSQQAAAQFTYTDLASVGAGLLVASALLPFGKQQVGNSLVITGGTNFTTGRYVIASVSAGLVATVLGAGNITTGAGVNGTGGQGGCYASPGMPGAAMVSSTRCYVKTGTYTMTSASTNVTGGCLSTAGSSFFQGYDTVRGDLTPVAAAGTRPTFVASGISSFTLVSLGVNARLANVILDGATLTTSRGMLAGSSGVADNVHGKNFTNGCFTAFLTAKRCSATTCSSVAPFNGAGQWFGCAAYANTVTGFGATVNATCCLSYGNTGASSTGFTGTAEGGCYNCVAYGNGSHGFSFGAGQTLVNCVAESNTGKGYDSTAAAVNGWMLNCAAYLNTAGNLSLAGINATNIGFLTGGGSFFTNAASGDFSLNNTAGAGALLRAGGWPGVLPPGLTTGYLDIGAAQHADPASSGGGGGAYMRQIGGGGIN